MPDFKHIDLYMYHKEFNRYDALVFTLLGIGVASSSIIPIALVAPLAYLSFRGSNGK